MASQSGSNDDHDKPLDPAVERLRRRLVRFVAINLGILFVALMAVVVALVYRASSVGTPAREAAPAVPGELPERAELLLPEGARVVSHALGDGRVSLHVSLPDGGQALLVYDLAGGMPLSRLDIAGEPAR